MKNAVALPLGLLILLAAVIAGCGSSQNAAAIANQPTPVPTPTTPCTPPSNYQYQMVFPQNGATGQPNLEGVVIAVAPSPLPTNWFIYATYSLNSSTPPQSTYGTSSIGFLATAAPSATPFPTPSDTPLFTPAVYESTSIGIFANSGSGTSTFTIYLANPTCYPGLQLSTFTTATTDQPTATPSPTST